MHPHLNTYAMLEQSRRWLPPLSLPPLSAKCCGGYRLYLSPLSRPTTSHRCMPVCRTAFIKKVGLGGLSRLTRDIIRRACIAERDFELTIGEVALKVRIVLKGIIGDEEALNMMFFSKGAGGICPCGVQCSIVNKQCRTDVDAGVQALSQIDPDIPDLSCPDLSVCGCRSANDIWGFCSALEAVRDDKEELKAMEHVLGLKYDRDTLLYAPDLRSVLDPPQQWLNDPLHIIFSNGLMGQEVALVTRSMKSHVNCFFPEIRRFCQEKGYKTNVFSEVRERNMTEVIKTGASELMSAYGYLRDFVHEVYGRNPQEPFAVSFLRLCRVADIIRLLLRGAPKPEKLAEALAEASSEYLRAFAAAHGVEAMRYKHHQLLHLSKDVIYLGLMLSCWVLERKHISAKAAIQNMKGILGIEKTGLARMLCYQEKLLQDPCWVDELMEPVNPFPQAAEGLGAWQVHVSAGMRWRGVVIKSQDIFFLDAELSYLVLVVGCLRMDNDRFACIIKRCAPANRRKFQSGATEWDVPDDTSMSILPLRTGEVFFMKPDHTKYPLPTSMRGRMQHDAAVATAACPRVYSISHSHQHVLPKHI